jgi:putative membrane protein
MERLLLRWLINGAALYAVLGTGWIRGIHAENTSWWGILILALIFGLVNALVRPLLKILTCPLIVLTLGLFTLVINTALFWLTGWLGGLLEVGFSVEGFWPAFLGGLVVSVVSWALSLLVRDELEPRRRRSY